MLHGVLGLAIITGVIDDRGIVNIGHARTLDQVGVIAVIEFLYFITFYTARVSQRVTLEAVEHLEQAVRGVAQREALLAEARAELDRALKIGGPGRFTDQIGRFVQARRVDRARRHGRGLRRPSHDDATRGRGQAAARRYARRRDPRPALHARGRDRSAKLDTPNVVRVLEVGTTTGEVPFLAMERLRGYDLAHQLRRQRRLQLAQAVVLVQHIAAGLEAARNAGIVHRDLKPHNVFFAQSSETWKILDFGVSKMGGSGTLTKGHVIGTPAYMAPEQAKGENVDHRADVYSLAAILYRAITGQPGVREQGRADDAVRRRVPRADPAVDPVARSRRCRPRARARAREAARGSVRDRARARRVARARDRGSADARAAPSCRRADRRSIRGARVKL